MAKYSIDAMTSLFKKIFIDTEASLQISSLIPNP